MTAGWKIDEVRPWAARGGYPPVGVPDSSGSDPMSMDKPSHPAELAAWYEGILTKVITAVGGALLNAELEHANLTPAELAVVERCESQAVGFTG